MLSLHQLLARHPTLLLVDSCSPRVEAAIWRSGAASADRCLSGVGATNNASSLPAAQVVTVDGEASAALPTAVARVFAASGLGLRDFDAIAFCVGPGSVLGIRLAAATLRTWRAVRPDLALYGFHSLPLLAAAHPGVTVIADARRDTWHAVGPLVGPADSDFAAVSADSPLQIRRLPTADLAACGPLATPALFRRWSAPPRDVSIQELAWSAAALLAAAPDTPFFSAAPEPDAFQHENPSYAAWTPQVHRGPGRLVAP